MEQDMGKGALVFTWSTPVRGREVQALEVFGKSLAHFQTLEQSGRVDSCRVYLSAAGNGGMVVLDADYEEVLRLYTDDEVHRIIARSNVIGEDFAVKIMVGGSPDAVQGATLAYAEVLAELGYA